MTPSKVVKKNCWTCHSGHIRCGPQTASEHVDAPATRVAYVVCADPQSVYFGHTTDTATICKHWAPYQKPQS